MLGATVQPISKKLAEKLVLTRHYSKRASIFWAGFGLIVDNKILGVVVYGQPSPPIQKHAFVERDFKLYELSRLVIQTSQPNAASFLIASSLKLLEQPCAVVSYADTEYNHAGIVYQATNWLYTGATKSHDHAYLIDGKRVHPTSLADKGITNPKQWARENGIETLPPCLKHRYFYICGNKKQKKQMLTKLKYPIVASYPKLDKAMYENGNFIDIKV